MKIARLSGKYVLAVSGGVDSVVLLDLLSKQAQKDNSLELIVAHFDHGIRNDSVVDRKLVEDLAQKLGLTFYYGEGRLGPEASEQAARSARYEFMTGVVKKASADGLITAHHQDDLIETAIINIVRGTNRKGLSSLATGPKVVRPLLKFPKSEIISYAKANKLNWREDPTNQDIKYLRNYIRLNIVPKLNATSRRRLLEIINKQTKLNAEIDQQLVGIINNKLLDNRLPRLWLNSLDSRLSREVVAVWLRENDLGAFDRATIERLVAALKTLSPGKQVDIFEGWRVLTTKDNLALEHVER